jgi:hypothetical protein
MSKTRCLTVASCSMLLLLTAQTALAEGDGRWYVTGSVGNVDYHMDLDSQMRSVCVGRCVFEYAELTGSAATGYRLGGGYRINDYLAVEVAAVDLGSVGSRYKIYYDGVWRRIDGNYRLDGIHAVVAARLPVTDKVAVTGRLGAFESRLRYSETGVVQIAYGPHEFVAPNDRATLATVGLGVEYRHDRHWAVRFDWDRYLGVGRNVAFVETDNGRFDSVNSYLLGVAYYF